MTWRGNNAGSFILPVNFYDYIDVWEQIQLKGRFSRYLLSRLFTTHLARVSWPSIQQWCQWYSHPSLRADPDVDNSWPQRGRKLYDRDLDHLPWPRSDSFAGLQYRVDRKRQYIGWMGCILASTEIWDWIYGISGSVVIVSWLSSTRNNSLLIEHRIFTVSIFTDLLALGAKLGRHTTSIRITWGIIKRRLWVASLKDSLLSKGKLIETRTKTITVGAMPW